jgi:hypothetical protein
VIQAAEIAAILRGGPARNRDQLRSLQNLTLQLLHRDSAAPVDVHTSYRELIQAAETATHYRGGPAENTQIEEPTTS